MSNTFTTRLAILVATIIFIFSATLRFIFFAIGFDILFIFWFLLQNRC